MFKHALLALSLCGIVAAGPCMAHAKLQSSSPADNAQLSEAPKTLTLKFSESAQLAVLKLVRDGKEIPLAPIMEEQSASYNEELASPAGTWHAKLQKLNHAGKLALEVRGNDGTIKTAFSAPYLPCAKDALPMPVELSILGWLDDNHLVYRDDSIAYYVFDASTGKTAFLFSASEDTHQFLW